MGSWSVSCGISNIAITSGNKCVLLPLIKDKGEYGGYAPVTLPIFGDYDDYGGLENIIEDENTKLIEEHLGITISEFVEYLVDGKFTYHRDEVDPTIQKLKDNGRFYEVENCRFMWIDKQVYDFMVVNIDNHSKGNLDYGTQEMLTALGFTLVETSTEFPNYDPKRFKEKWIKGDFEVYSDKKTMLSMTNQYLFYFGKGGTNSIETYFEIPDELQYLKTKTKNEAWRVLKPIEQKRILGYIFGNKGYNLDMEGALSFLTGIKPKPKTILEKYLANLDVFGDKIVGLINIRENLHPMSGRFYPHVLYLTPQCGEHNHHQKILEAFVKINKTYLDEDDNDDE